MSTTESPDGASVGSSRDAAPDDDLCLDMTLASQHLRALADRVLDETLQRVPLRAALLVGSAGRGDADFFSDIDLLFYVDALPSQEVISEIRDALGGAEPQSKAPTEHFLGEEFTMRGVRTEISFMTVGHVDTRLDELLDQLIDLDAPSQKVLMGLLEGLPLFGRELVESWRTRVGDYPEPLRRAMLKRYWSFFPLWYYGAAMAQRDAELWRLDVLLEAAFHLLGVLAALNRLYFTRFQLKRTRAFVARMPLAPARLADRLESLFRLDPESAAAELERLIEETRILVRTELPDLEAPLDSPPRTRQQPWSI